jgi:hypothetical protein
VPGGQQATGKTVADALGSNATVEVDKTVAAGHVTVFLGIDYSGQATPRSSTQSSSPTQPDPATSRAITAAGVTCVN